ncbi:hypothetical protein K491DRAFT_755 [Lophiostoma macrostomum CBS 122681]|uniref:Uncharacterized protein n=1 Tax=Lophiostoma macrostomum CBS 122681 TaxID=1314788 RepID=A0A6A6TTU3_9PLEO|nr:hypothetical protein K491DRAFT_755 [Lophiostoma macrostomum CBS 122681]
MSSLKFSSTMEHSSAAWPHSHYHTLLQYFRRTRIPLPLPLARSNLDPGYSLTNPRHQVPPATSSPPPQPPPAVSIPPSPPCIPQPWSSHASPFSVPVLPAASPLRMV